MNGGNGKKKPATPPPQTEPAKCNRNPDHKKFAIVCQDCMKELIIQNHKFSAALKTKDTTIALLTKKLKGNL